MGKATAPPFADTVRRARYDFHRTVVELFQERFLATYVQWCHDNGVLSRVQAYGRETHPIDGGLLIDIPEGESWFWGDHDRIVKKPTVVNRYVSSAARLAGKRLTSHEAMTNAVPAFRVTLADMKLLLDMSLLTGVLHPVIHGFNYSPPEAGFPGWVRYGTWLNEKNPWWPHVRRFTDYSARLTSVLVQSDGQASLAILGPRADEWARHVRLYQPFPEIAVPWYHYALPDALASAGYGSDFVSENVLQETTAADGRLRFGPREWEGLLVLDAESLEPETARAIERFARAGGRVLFVGRAPDRSPGLFEAEARDRAVREAIEAARAVDSARIARRARPRAGSPRRSRSDASLPAGLRPPPAPALGHDDAAGLRSRSPGPDRGAPPRRGPAPPPGRRPRDRLLRQHQPVRDRGLPCARRDPERAPVALGPRDRDPGALPGRGGDRRPLDPPRAVRVAPPRLRARGGGPPDADAGAGSALAVAARVADGLR